MAAFDEKEYTQAFDWSIWRRLLPILAHYRGHMAAMIAFSAMGNLIDEIGRASWRERVEVIV